MIFIDNKAYSDRSTVIEYMDFSYSDKKKNKMISGSRLIDIVKIDNID